MQPPRIEAIDHINLVVRDLPTMTAFYRDLLGLRVTKEVTIEGAWIEAVVGLRGVVGDVVYLDPPTDSKNAIPTRIELIRYRSPEGALPPGLDQPNTPGLRHLAFRVADIDALAAKLRQRGVRFLGQPQLVPDDQVTYTGGIRKRLVYFLDPENNLLELCEYR